MAMSLNTFQKMMFGMGLANAILMALVDNKLTAGEMIQVMQYAVTGLGGKFKVTTDDFTVLPNEDGSVDLHFSERLVNKLSISV